MFVAVMGIEYMALSMRGQGSTTELHLEPEK